MIMVFENKVVGVETQKTIHKMVEMLAIATTPEMLAEIIMKSPELKFAIKGIILREIDVQCQNLCTRSPDNSSVLRVPRSSHKDLKTFSWEKILLELQQRAPDVLDFLVTVASPQVKKDAEKKIPPICEAYGILMNCRWQELSIIQKINTLMLGVGHATARTLQRMSRAGITQTRESYRLMLDDIGADLMKNVQNKIAAGHQLRICYDNIDFRILVNIILKNHQNSDNHWIAHYLTFDRVPSDGLDDRKPLVSDSREFDNINYLLAKDELDSLRQNFIVLVARVFSEFFDFMKPMANAVPKHIPHRYSAHMEERSTIVGLPVFPFNQSKLADVCQYLDKLQELLHSVTQEGEERNELKLKVPLYGDLLGRERVTGAKRARMGCDEPLDRYDNITEAPGLWHAKQAYLKFVWEELYKATPSCGREVGTLYHLRQSFKLVNVPSDVRKNYASCESLLISATKAYLCSAFLTWSKITSTNETPAFITKQLKKYASIAEKWQFLESYLGKFVDEFVLTEFDIEKKWEEENEKWRKEKEQEQNNQRLTPASTENLFPPGQVVVLLERQASEYKVLAVGVVAQFSSFGPPMSQVIPVNIYHVEDCAKHQLTCSQQVLWPKTLLARYNPPPSAQARPSQQETSPEPELQSCISGIRYFESEDGLLNYGLQVIQLGVFLMQMNDTEAEGDGERSLINWKLLMLYYRCRSRGMKYAFEAMRFITCTRALFTEKMAHRILHGQFVNPRGGAGNNYANDLKMEHLIRDNKVILKDLGVNKTLKAVERCSKAAYGMKEFCNSFDKECNIPPETAKHSHACTTDDVRDMLSSIHKNEPFKHHPGRTLNSFPQITKTPLDKLNISLLHSWLTRHKQKLFSGITSLDDEVDEVDEECSDSSADNEDLDDQL